MSDLCLHEYMAKIDSLIRNNRHGESMSHCLHILSFRPKNIQACYLLGEACLAGQSYQAARELFQCTLSADPEHLGAWLGLADSYELEGKALWALDPENRVSQEVMGEESPLPLAEVLVAEREAGTALSPPAGALVEMQASVPTIPQWVRELELEPTE